MAVVPVSQLKGGERLNDQVFTKRGSLLFDKGVYVTARELEILRSFMISLVSIESKGGSEPPTEEQEQQQNAGMPAPLNPLFQEYDAMVAMFRKVVRLAEAGAELPILEIRTGLEGLLRHIEHYNILTFAPRNKSLKEYLVHSSILSALTSCQLAKWHGLPVKDHLPVALGGLLHDIGNARVDPALLEKKTKLTPAEMEEVRKHTVLGYQMVKGVAGINEGVKLCALQHHEREDGSGYPLGLKGDKIHPYAKIIAVADIFHAMTNNRHYKNASSPYLVLEQLQKESFGKLDPTIVQTFIHRVTQFHNGTLVRLNDNRIGEIVFSDRNHPTRPWVNVNGTIINLTLDRSVHIQEVIQNFA